MNVYMIRGKVLACGEWGYWQPATDEVESESIGLWTGLTDKNGKLVFEGDIIRYDDIGNISTNVAIGVVKFGRHKTADNHKHIGFYIDWIVSPDATRLCHADFADWFGKTGAIVVGNITDNPEMLEVKDNG